MAIGRRKRSRGRACLLMNSLSVMLARGEMLDVEQKQNINKNIQIKVTDGNESRLDTVSDAEVLQIVTQDQSQPMLLGRMIYRQDNHIILEPIRGSGRDARQNLRMPVDFETYIYPKRGGRCKILSKDMSCGGISFYADCKLEIGEEGEIVIPITEDGPLLLYYQILRASPHQGSVSKYATKFLHLINEQETLLREAVFNVQLEIRNAQNLAQRRG